MTHGFPDRVLHLLTFNHLPLILLLLLLVLVLVLVLVCFVLLAACNYR